MPGNMRKLGYEKPAADLGYRGGSLSDYRDALTDDAVVKGVNQINRRVRRENHEKRAEDRTAAERRKITLPSPEWLANFMKDAPDET